MCTVTIVPLPGADPGAFRLACNRDERRTRRPALPPELRTFGRRSGLMPVDADAGGTWVAVNDAGLAMSLLNLTPPPPGPNDPPVPEPGSRSRGAIIPGLLHHDGVAAAVAEASRIDPEAQRPFRLVLVDRTERAVLRGDGRTIRVVRREPSRGPFMLTSSGLGDHLVEGPRRELFDRMLGGPGARIADPVAAQDAFHRSHWPDRGHLSVSMERAEAMTLSHTVVWVRPEAVEMSHSEGPPRLQRAPAASEPAATETPAHPATATATATTTAAAPPLRLPRRARTAG